MTDWETTTPFEIEVDSTRGFVAWDTWRESGDIAFLGITIDDEAYVIVRIVDEHTMLIAKPKGWIAHLN